MQRSPRDIVIVGGGPVGVEFATIFTALGVPVTRIDPTLASIATQQGRAAVCHAFGLVFGVPVDRAPSAAVYGLPELAGVGATEEQVQNAGTPYVVGRCDLSQTARGAIAGTEGRLKLIVRADDRKLLGVHCVGDIASELVGMGHAVLHMGGAIDVFLTLALNTPTYCSAYRDATIDVMRQLALLAGRDPHVSKASPIDNAPTSAVQAIGAQS
jgi:NAD(P) transhydrogenase